MILVVPSGYGLLAVFDLWNGLLASSRHAVYVFQSCTVLRDSGKGEEKEANKLLLASRYRYELIGKVVGISNNACSFAKFLAISTEGELGRTCRRNVQ